MCRFSACSGEPPDYPAGKALRSGALNQSGWWFPKNGKAVKLCEMDVAWKANCIAWMEHRATYLAYNVANKLWAESGEIEAVHHGDPPDGVFSAQNQLEAEAALAKAAPVTWLRGKPLYKELTRQIHKGVGPTNDATAGWEPHPGPEWTM